MFATSFTILHVHLFYTQCLMFITVITMKILNLFFSQE